MNHHNSNTLKQLNRWLYDHYGDQQWWPATSRFEVMIGAILTQNTSWTNVERALQGLQSAIPLEPEALLTLELSQLAQLIRPSGYFNVKAARLQHYCRWFLQQGGFAGLDQLTTPILRQRLLAVHGIGPETADDMLLYAFQRPVFVVDSYTKRLFARVGLVADDIGYEVLRAWVEAVFVDGDDVVQLFNELHAMIVIHAKQYCRKKPLCEGCPLRCMCQYERSETGV